MGYLRSTLACIILITVACVSSCSWVTWEELSRISSPDHKVEAVLEINNPAGAMNHPSYRVSIVPAGKKPTNDDRFLAYDYIHGEEIQWISPRVLEIKYENASIQAFKNYWYSLKIEGYKAYSVEIRLVKK